MRINNIIILSLVAAFTLSQCTPKAAEKMETVVEAPVEVEETKSWRSITPSPAPARKIQLGSYHTFSLKNGLDVIVVENSKLPRVAYNLSLKNNPVIEGAQAGYVAITGDLISRGTTSKSKSEIDAAVDFIGGTLFTNANGMFVASLKKHKDELLDLASDVLYNPAFSNEEFEKVKTQVVSGLQTAKTDPNSMASNVSNVLNYSKAHPYGEVETEETVANIKIESCKAYFNSYFKPNNAYLTIVGDTNLEEAKRDAEKYFGSWKKGEIPENNYGLPKGPDDTQVSFVNKEGAVQSVINITYPVNIKPGSKDAIPATLMNAILGGGVFSGRLMQNLREDKAFTYGARSRISTDPLASDFVAFASVRNEVTDSSLVEFLYEMNRMNEPTITAEDLQLAKNSSAGSFARSLESPQSLATYALNIQRYNLPSNYYETYLEKLEAVTLADIQAMAKKYIRADKANIVVVGNKDEVADKLKRFDTDGKIDFYDAFANVVEVMEEVAEDVKPEDVISKYISASYGKHAPESLQSVQFIYSMDMMGQTAEINTYVKDRNKAAMEMSLAGNVMQAQKYDGTKVQVSGMGQNQIVEEGDMFDQMKSMTYIIEQSKYLDGNHSLMVKGMEEIDGRSCYKIIVVNPADVKKTEFYDVETGYLLQSVVADKEKGTTIITKQSEYTDVEGYFFPMKIVTTGAAPFPLEMIGKEIKINPDLSDDIFSIK